MYACFYHLGDVEDKCLFIFPNDLCCAIKISITVLSDLFWVCEGNTVNWHFSGVVFVSARLKRD